MLNPLKFVTKLFKSTNEKELERILLIVKKINELENEISNLKNEDFPKKTKELKQKLNDGIELNKILPEASGNILFNSIPSFNFCFNSFVFFGKSSFFKLDISFSSSLIFFTINKILSNSFSFVDLNSFVTNFRGFSISFLI